MQSIDIKSRPKEKFKKNIEVALKEILKEYDVTQRTNCDYIRLYFNDTYSIIIKMLDIIDDNKAVNVRMFMYDCDSYKGMYIADTVLMSKEDKYNSINNMAIDFLVNSIMHGYEFLEKEATIDDTILIAWNLNEKVDISDRIITCLDDSMIKEEEMNPEDFACYVAAACDKYNNMHNNKLYMTLSYRLEPTEDEHLFTSIITIEELITGGFAYTVEYVTPSLYNEETRRSIRVTRAYNIKQLVTVLEKASKWYFDLRDVRLPGEEFAFDISVLRPEFWS